MSTSMTPILQTAIPSTNSDISGSFLAAGLTIRLSVTLKASGQDTLTLLRRNDTGYWETTGYSVAVSRGSDFSNASASIEIPVNAADSYHVMSETGFATSGSNASVKLNSLQPPSGLASVPSHGSTHTSIGGDAIPLAVEGGASGLMSGTQAAQLAQLTGGVPGTTQTLTTSVADGGASTIAYISDNSIALTAGRLWSERNAGVEKFAVRFDGGAIAPTIGPVYTQQHTLPAVASDTIALIAATQTFTNKTLTSPVIAGMTATGATAINLGGATSAFTGPTGAYTLVSTAGAITITAGAASTWKTSSGALSVDGFAGLNLKINTATLLDIGATSATAVTLAANIGLVGAAGTGPLTLGAMTGATTMPTGNWDWTGASTKTFAVTSTGAGSTISISAGAASTWKTTSGALTLDGNGGVNLQVADATIFDVGVTSATKVTLAANIDLNGAAGTGAVSLGSLTGAFTFPTGNISYTGASTKSVSFVTSGAGGSITLTAAVASTFSTVAGALTLTSAGAATWSTVAGALTLTSAGAATWSTAAGTLTLSGFAGIAAQVNGTTVIDFGATSATKTTLAANKDLACAAGTTAVDLSLGTGTFKPPTGLFTFQGKQAAAATANTLTDPGNAGAIAVTSDGVCMLTSAGAETRTIAIPTYVGQKIILICDTYVGDIVVTAAQSINQANNTIMTFGAAADMIVLEGCKVGGNFRWRVTGNDGVALS